MRKLSVGAKVALIVGALVLTAIVGLVAFRQAVASYYIPSKAMAPTLMVNDHIIVSKVAYRDSDPERGDVVVFKSPPEAHQNEKDFVKRVVAVGGDKVRITPGYVAIGDRDCRHPELRELLGSPGTETAVKLEDGKVLVNGKAVALNEIADTAGEPKAKVIVHPGRLYLNGKALNEPYVAEDCDLPYPMPSTPSEWIVTEKGVRSVKIPAGKLLVMGDNRNDSNDSRFWGLLDRERVTGKAVRIMYPESRAGEIR